MPMNAVNMAQNILQAIQEWGYEMPGPDATQILPLITASIIDEFTANAVVAWPDAYPPGSSNVYGFVAPGTINVGAMVTAIHNLLVGHDVLHDFFDQINGTRLVCQGMLNHVNRKSTNHPPISVANELTVKWQNAQLGTVYRTYSGIVSGTTGPGMTARFETKIKAIGGTLDGVSLISLDDFFTGINNELLNMSIRAFFGGGGNLHYGVIQ